MGCRVMKEVHGLFTSKLSMLPRPIYKSVLRSGQEQGCSTEYSIGSVVLRGYLDLFFRFCPLWKVLRCMGFFFYSSSPSLPQKCPNLG